MEKSNQRKKPNLFVVGAPKCGTTTLFYLLGQHPDIFFPNPKEINYFQGADGIRNSSYYNDIRIKSEQEYLAFYKNKEAKILGDGSVSYFADRESPSLIHRFNPDAKIIICARNPVSRAFSHYLMDRALGLVKADFGEIIRSQSPALSPFKAQYLDNGLFAENTKVWVELFGEGNVLVLGVKELTEKDNIGKLFRFLGVDDLTVDTEMEVNAYKEYRNPLFQFLSRQRHVISFFKKYIDFRKIPGLKKMAYVEAEKPVMSQEDRTFLNDFYAGDLEAFQKRYQAKI